VERAEWLKKMRTHAEALYNHLAPAYWVTFGLYANTTHRQFIEMFLYFEIGSSAVNQVILPVL
jgi:hypothetical protein